MQKIEVRRFSTAAASYEVMELVAAKPLVCSRIGDPGLLNGCRFSAADCRKVKFPSACFGFGLGAFGDGFEDAQTRFGEFLAVDGAAAYLPTDGSNVPDFMVSRGDLVPEMNVLYGLQEGGFLCTFSRFSKHQELRVGWGFRNWCGQLWCAKIRWGAGGRNA